MSDQFKQEYLGVWPGPGEGFEFRCRNCKRLPDEHVGDACLFESTVWVSMTLDEVVSWRKAQDTAGVEDDDYVPINPKE